MNRKLINLSLGVLLSILSTSPLSVFADIYLVDLKQIKDEIIKDEIVLEGKIEKREDGFYLITTNEVLKLPVAKEEKDKIQLDEFVDKDVVLIAKGSIVNHDKEGNVTTDKHIIIKIVKVQIVLKDEAQKEEKK